MRIAFFVSVFPALSETFVINQIIELKRTGHQVHIYAQSKSKEELVHSSVTEYGLLQNCVFLDGLPKHRMAKILQLFSVVNRICSLKTLKQFFQFLKNATKEGLSVYEVIFYLGKPNYDVVHAHFGVNGNYVARLQRAGLFQESRFVTTFHGYDLEVEEKNCYNHLFQIANVFTTNSDFSAQKLLNLGCPAGKLVKVPVGLDVNYFKKEAYKKQENKPFTILFVGRLVPFKGPDQVVQVCNCLKNKGVSFRAFIVGEGEMKRELSEMIRKLALEEEVKMLGPKLQADIRNMMAEADVFLLPGRTINGRAENQGLVLQEAQAMGVPVIISDAGGMKEGVIDGVTGIVVKENNVSGFVEALFELFVNSAKRQRMALQARKFVEDEFSISQLNRRLLRYYSKR